jgi:hypothetical protein
MKTRVVGNSITAQLSALEFMLLFPDSADRLFENGTMPEYAILSLYATDIPILVDESDRTRLYFEQAVVFDEDDTPLLTISRIEDPYFWQKLFALNSINSPFEGEYSEDGLYVYLPYDAYVYHIGYTPYRWKTLILQFLAEQNPLVVWDFWYEFAGGRMINGISSNMLYYFCPQNWERLLATGIKPKDSTAFEDSVKVLRKHAVELPVFIEELLG